MNEINGLNKPNKPNKRLNLSVQYISKNSDIPRRAEIFPWARAALSLDENEFGKIGGKIGGKITIRFVEADEALALNLAYRQKNYATNVLSFAYETDPIIVGDLVICAAVVKKEAFDQNKDLQAHYAHLIVHGVLHLQGFDHETSQKDAKIMEEAERKILASFGFHNPYED